MVNKSLHFTPCLLVLTVCSVFTEILQTDKKTNLTVFQSDWICCIMWETLLNVPFLVEKAWRVARKKMKKKAIHIQKCYVFFLVDSSERNGNFRWNSNFVPSWHHGKQEKKLLMFQFSGKPPLAHQFLQVGWIFKCR